MLMDLQSINPIYTFFYLFFWHKMKERSVSFVFEKVCVKFKQITYIEASFKSSKYNRSF